MLWLLLQACGPSQPEAAPEHTPAARSLEHVEAVKAHGQELERISGRLLELEEELRTEARDPALIQAEMRELVDRSRELSESVDAELDAAESLLRAP